MSLMIRVCHHSASLVMPMRDPRDGFFYPSPTLMRVFFYNIVPKCDIQRQKLDIVLREINYIIVTDIPKF